MPNPQINQAGKLDLLIQQGSSFERVLTFTGLTITDYSFRGQIRKTARDREIQASFNFTIVNDTVVRVSLTPQQSAQLEVGNNVYDIEIFQQVSGVDTYVARILEGKVRVTAEVTR